MKSWCHFYFRRVILCHRDLSLTQNVQFTDTHCSYCLPDSTNIRLSAIVNVVIVTCLFELETAVLILYRKQESTSKCHMLLLGIYNSYRMC